MSIPGHSKKRIMLSFLKKIFSSRLFHRGMSHDGMLELGLHKKAKAKPAPRVPDADVHKLMIRATQIRKQDGYHAAVKYLKGLAEDYLQSGNTALVTCINKLIPYMKRDPKISFEETRRYLQQVIDRSPGHDPLFENLHITMAELIRSKNTDDSIDYLIKQTSTTRPGRDDFGMFILLADLFIEKHDQTQAQLYLEKSKQLLHPRIERFAYIRRLRKWYQTAAFLSQLDSSRQGAKQYLEYRFIECCLDMARVLDPWQIHLFHERKELYMKKERGFEDSELFRNALVTLLLEEKKDELLSELYRYAFQEMPLAMKVTEKQLNFKNGDPESLEELQEKKNYSQMPFNELPLISDHIKKLLDNYILDLTQ